MPRKRAPGAGRPPAGPISGKLSNFSTRITHETRVALEAEAGRTGQSISQVAERMISLGLTTKREREKSSPTQALSFMIAELAEESNDEARIHGKKFRWHTDRLVFDALANAIGFLLGYLRKTMTLTDEFSHYLREGKGVPDYVRAIVESPEIWAKHIFFDLWAEVMNPQQLPDEKTLAEYKNTDPSVFGVFGEGGGDLRKLFQRPYNLEKVRRDLNLKIRRESKGEDQ
jgi:hypothetical protein